MELYNQIIKESLSIIENDEALKKFPISKTSKRWKLEKEQKLIFQKEMAYELGGDFLPALSGLAFTTQKDFESEVWLLGDDLNEIKENSPYARLTILNVDDSSWSDNQKAYSAMQKIDYTRFHIYPEGFMIRISTSAAREPVRISKKAVKKGLNFEKTGTLFVDGYCEHPDVTGAKVIFITKRDFPYEKLAKQLSKMEDITNSLDKIFRNLIMDCRTCNLKTVCDEVEGLRQYHQKGLS